MTGGVSTVDVMTPPMTARPSGARKSASSPEPIATGVMPAINAKGVKHARAPSGQSPLRRQHEQCYNANIMIARTMLYLESAQLDALKERARAERISVTELMRRLIRQHVASPGREPATAADWNRLVGLGESGRPDVGDNHDQALGAALTREHLR